jgi:hypothetical protein
VRDIDTAVADSLKVLDPNRPIREADISPRAEKLLNINETNGWIRRRSGRFSVWSLRL